MLQLDMADRRVEDALQLTQHLSHHLRLDFLLVLQAEQCIRLPASTAVHLDLARQVLRLLAIREGRDESIADHYHTICQAITMSGKPTRPV